ncbi:conserved hypothetical protein [Leishmania major strain Friedlin]|uniref:Uncharacterized protein L8530.06 n=1 Tax=Leishmania major TaxID=5664 RepID=Q9GRN0_LEIMA|nr:conserved hypothetical protein [Leishmania major strain Friedlin]CAC14609.1 hypothetical protein L8530.06 [Leishmania major]CAG9580816.1 hypothetical_protein_-_conserved [Leishmania major strain Friedlin]CAJ06579.1 conserved hypothetical protein [Leishmania major strain Friedlin]|eukprot:XP_001685978.1 conserved hypothetical protein [Leishmania major strain Friedlin]
MGAFALCVESAARDIRSLLTLHRVHPQVHSDIQRILGSLLRKNYENMTAPVPMDLIDPPEQVCRELVNDIVENAFKTALPASDMRALEHRCVELQQDNAELKAAVEEADESVMELRAVLSDLKKAHEYMLHSYFREVLMLRSRIDDLQRQLRTRRLHTTNLAPLVSGSVSQFIPTTESPLQHFLVNTSVATGQGEPTSRSSTSPLGTPLPPSMSSDEESEADDGPVRRLLSNHISYHGEGRCADVQAQARPHALGAATVGAAPAAPPDAKGWSATPHPKYKGYSVRINVPISTAARARTPGSARSATAQKTTTFEVWSTEPDSVDAIFDYEEYLRILNGADATWMQRFTDAMDGWERGSPRHRRHSLSLRACTKSKVSFLSGSLASNPDDPLSSATLSNERVNANGFRWLLHLALEPIKHKFHMELDQLREAVQAMQQEHADQVQRIECALLTVQSRNDALLDFINTFAQQARQTLLVVARDVQARNMVELLSSGALPVAAAETVASFFTPAASAATPHVRPSLSSATASPLPHPESAQVPSASHLLRNKEWRLKPGVVLEAQEQASMMTAMNHRLGKASSVEVTRSMPHAPTNAAEEVNYYRADLGLPYWCSHPVTVHARKMFGEVQEIAASIRATRAMHFLASKESAAGGGRRVRWKVRGTADSSRHDDGDHRGCNSPPPLLKGRDSSSFYYFRDCDADDDSTLRHLVAHRRQREEWLTASVSGADGQTAADLLRELAALRMRRACDRKRLKVVQASLPQHFMKDAAASAMAEEAAVAKEMKKGAGARARATDPEPESPHLQFVSAEALLRACALQRLGRRTEQRLMQASQRIAELQRLLDLHLGHCQLKDSEDSLSWETARRLTAEGSQGLLGANGTLNLAGHLWRSPYLNDTVLDANDQQQQQRGTWAGYSRGQLMYLPIGLAMARDADGNSIGGAGAYFMLDGSVISAAPFAPFSTAASKGGQGSNEESERPAMPGRITPFVAVMEYCRGVQMGRPLGRRAGPVYLFQDHESGDYYVGDQAGRNVLKADDDTAGDAVGMRAEAGTQRPLLPMTRILFPAPMQFTAVDASSVASSVAASAAASTALHPIYLVPMAIPLSDEEAVMREGWQACHRHGHTRRDPIYYTTMTPLPLSKSYHHVVPQPGNADAVALAEAAADVAAVSYNDDSNAPVNRYLRNPPCVFQPADEAAAMMRVRSLQLQQRRGANKSFPDTAAVDSSAACAHSGLLSPDGTASSAVTPTSTLPSSVGPLSGYALSSPEAHLLGAVPLLAADWQGSGGPVAAAPLPGSSSSPPAVPLALPPSPEPGTTLAKTGHNGVQPLTKPVPHTSAAAAAAAAPASSATSFSPPLAAALVLAKERRYARLAEEAERAAQAKKLRQDSLRNRTLTRTAPNKESDVPRVPPHRLAPLSGKHPGDEVSSMLPLPADSARLQSQMRPAKLALTPPPPSLRWREVNGGGLNAWNLSSDDGDAA